MNRLAAESSPYLRQHAENPVDWYPWSPEAFAAAQDRDVPILLSIGYSSCHWCHVMAHESFEDPAIAATMNKRFVNIKVDREERPDVDAIYMEAVQRMAGQGGWPLNVFLTPDGRPFFGGTYFPRVATPHRAGFAQILVAVSDAWHSNRDELLEQGANLTALIADRNLMPTAAAPALTVDTFDEARRRLVAQADLRGGGFGGAPKFPMAMTLTFLAHEAARTGDGSARAVVERSLDAMAAGGIHDHVGGGFHRYSTDDQWLVPHFEKMLYDQATLLRAYTTGFALTGSETYRRVAAGIVGYVARDLRADHGGWYAAEDADSGGVEGAYTCWQPGEIRAVLGPDADALLAWAGVTESGNFSDPHTGFTGSILHAADGDPDLPPALHSALERLRVARAQRPRPGLDTKVLLGWNALFADALAQAAIIFEQPAWLDDARSAARFLLETFETDDGWGRSWQEGAVRHAAVLEDVAALCGLCVTLAELDDPAWIDPARRVAAALDRYVDERNIGWFTARDDVALVVRPKDFTDNAEPAGNSLAADALLRLAALTGEPSHADRARALCEALSEQLTRHPLAFGHLLRAAERVVFPSREIVVVGDQDGLRATALRALGPNDVFAFAPATVMSSLPLFEGRTGPDAPYPRAYVCRDGVCDLPVATTTELAAQLGA